MVGSWGLEPQTPLGWSLWYKRPIASAPSGSCGAYCGLALSREVGPVRNGNSPGY